MRKLLALVAILSLGMAQVASADSVPSVRNAGDAMAPWTITVYNDFGADIATGLTVAWDYTDSDLNTERKPYITMDLGVDDVAAAGIVYGQPCKSGSLCEIAVFGPVPAVCDDSASTIDAGDGLGLGTNAGHLDETAATDNTRVVAWAMTAEGGTDSEPCVVFANFITSPQAQ